MDTTSAVEIRPYGSLDEDESTRILVAAFNDDPAYEHAFPTKRPKALNFILRRMLRMRAASEGSRVLVAQRGGSTIGVLSGGAGEVRFGLADYFVQGLIAAPFHLGLQTTRRMLDADGEIGAFKKRNTPGEPHQYISQLAVAPQHQGQGVGRELLTTFLGAAAAVNQPTLLLTTNPSNVPWYERFGFESVGETMISDAFRAWCMVHR